MAGSIRYTALAAALMVAGCSEAPAPAPSAAEHGDAAPTAASAPAAKEASTDPYVAGVDAWHAEREVRLQRLQGWLALVGLHWV